MSSKRGSPTPSKPKLTLTKAKDIEEVPDEDPMRTACIHCVVPNVPEPESKRKAVASGLSPDEPVPAAPSDTLALFKAMQERLAILEARDLARSNAPTAAGASPFDEIAGLRQERLDLEPAIATECARNSPLIQLCRQGTMKVTGWQAKSSDGAWGVSVNILPPIQPSRYYQTTTTYQKPFVSLTWVGDEVTNSLQPTKAMKSTSLIKAITSADVVTKAKRLAQIDTAIREAESKVKASKPKVLTVADLLGPAPEEVDEPQDESKPL